MSCTRILGIDPGTRVVGYALVEVPTRSKSSAGPGPARFDYVECGVLRARARDEMHVRLVEIASGLRELLAEFQPHELAIERAFHGLNAASALTLAEARGAFKLIALEHGLSVAEYAPAMIKRAVTGRGRATKAEVQARVQLLCRLAKEPQADAADALATAICHVQARRLSGVTEATPAKAKVKAKARKSP
ncbi:crossover junction endodeoxyribonuclease RuvC [Plesiocystis pacifica SIR-1]|uniref:Crossover junction endodeoxyribonuclease RuvC n=1 Tax=Plesiocystis pacifica SIR-1 TaxID=391625 RepID=A6GES0_9BACT|nr:crossover junction endodeoxyribonuclease RuvC [Plesiocystis pacifica]EDM75653.1 crossover junction endodeoxyribonuclease RuvC [Plesiocystis pacifica SIR-1]